MEKLKQITLIHFDSGKKFLVKLNEQDYNRVKYDQDYVDEIAERYYELYQKGLVKPQEKISIEQTRTSLTGELSQAPSIEASTSSRPGSFSQSITTLSQRNASVWDRNVTLALFELYKKNKSILDNPKYKKKYIYGTIAQQLEEHGFNFTGEQCMNRMKTLLKKYKETNDHNNTSENDHKHWQHFEDMSEFLGDKPFVKPVAPCSSISLASRQKIDLSHEKESSRGTTAQAGTPKKRKVVASPRQYMAKWLNEYKKEVQAREDVRLKVVERHHEENKKLLESLITTLRNPKTE